MQSGGAFGMSLRMHEADVKLISGEPKRWTRPSNSSGRPKICYSAGPAEYAFGTKPAGSGTLDDPSQLAPSSEGWSKRKAPWLTIHGLKTSYNTQPVRK
jgi:hypothetical protein